VYLCLCGDVIACRDAGVRVLVICHNKQQPIYASTNLTFRVQVVSAYHATTGTSRI